MGATQNYLQKVAPMPVAARPLTDAAIRKAVPGDKPRKLSDGGGL